MGDEPSQGAREELVEIRAQLRLLLQRVDMLERGLNEGLNEGLKEGLKEERKETLEERPAAQPAGDAEAGAAASLEALRAGREATRQRSPAAPPPLPSPASREPASPGGPVRRPTPERTLADLEWLVGAKGVVLVGVLILVIAAGLFLKEAWDRGWVDQVPGWVRCLIGAGFGLALVGVGEGVRRRINPLASSGVSAAGLAIVFGSILAAARLYGLLGLPWAFALLALTSLAGVALGALSSRVLLAALSLAGAFVVPLVVRSDAPSYVVMPFYLLALLAMGLVLAGWKGRGFAVIRPLAWWGTAVLGTLWGLATLQTSAASPAIFAGLVWAMTIAELVASARFFERLRPSAAWPSTPPGGFIQVDAAGAITLDLRELFTPQGRWVNASFGVTAWASVLAGYAIYEHAPALAWIAPAVLLVASLATAFALAPHPPRLWAPSGSARLMLSTAMAINAAGLLAATIATGLGGPAEVVSWALVGLAAVVFGWRVRMGASVVLGLAFIGVALARLVSFDLFEALWLLDGGELATRGVLGLRFSAWSAQLALVSATLVASAVLLRASPYRTWVALVAIAAVAIMLIGPGSSVLSVGSAWAALGVALAWLGARVRRYDVRVAALALLALGSALVAVRTLADLAQAPPARPDRLWIGWTNASYALLIVALAWLAWTARRGMRPIWRASGVVLAAAAVALAIEGDGLPMPTRLVAWAVLVMLIALAGFASELLGARTDRGSRTTPTGGPLRRWMLPQVCVVLAVLLAGVWLGERAIVDWGQIDAPALLHRAVLSWVLIMSLLAASGWLVRRARPVPTVWWHRPSVNELLRIISWSAAGVLAFVGSSSELYRVVQRVGVGGEAAPDAALSIWWSLFAVGLIVAGMRAATPALRWVGLGLLGATSLKVLVIDMAALDGLTRIAGSTVVGLVLLAAGGGYAWAMDRAKHTTPQEQIGEQAGQQPS